MPPSSNLPVLASPGLEAEAHRLARQLGTEVIATPPPEGVVLGLCSAGLALHTFGKGAPGPVQADFIGGALGHRRRYGGGRNQDIARAVGVNRKAALSVVDLTAGLGRDAFVLASLGATVTLVERNPVVAALLDDGMQRARRHASAAGVADAELADILSRMALVHADSRPWLLALPAAEWPDVIYLDPMFPERRKSARVKKDMAAFHGLVGADDDADELLAVALERVRYRVVVKRPSGAPPLAGRAAASAIVGKSTRFDIYARQRIPGT